MDLRDLQTIDLLKRLRIYGAVRKSVAVKSNGVKKSYKALKQKKEDKINKKTKDITISKNDLIIIYDSLNEVNELLQNETLKKFVEDNKFKIKKYKRVKYYNSKTYNKDCLSDYDIIKNLYQKSFIYYSSKCKFDLKKVYNSLLIKNTDELTKKLNSVEMIKLFSNYCDIKNVNVRCTTFFDFEGKNYYSGGAERYLIDLHEILEKKGINMNVYQESNYPFFRKYRDINVIGVALKGQKTDYSTEYYRTRCDRYNDLAKLNKSQLNIYSAFFESFPFVSKPSIGISHGVAWDHESNKYYSGIHFEIDKKPIIEGAMLCDRLISVDNNTANWFQTLDYDLGCNKFDVIPNYVDVEEFTPRDDYLVPKDKIVITYPRRLYAARGMYTLLNITDKIIEKHKNVEIHFVGKGFDKDLKEIQKKMKKFPKNVFCYSKDPKEMHEVYKMTDISVIPTRYSEGTSLSCLEAMASGNLVISTRIGGLTDLVINGYNGYLIESSEKSLFEALDDAITNYKERIIYKERAREVAKAFNKEKWKKSWSSIFDEFKLIKTEDNKIELVEYYINDFENCNEKIYNSIKDNLQKNKLVYIRLEDSEKCDEFNKKYAGEMLQFIGRNIETVLNSHEVYVEKGNKYKNKDNKIINI